MQLFQWRYEDIATECCDFLGPNGISAVQTSPVVEQRQGSEWWLSYQPVSYLLGNRLGNESGFRQMCETCRTCGVDVLVDVVMNHMGERSGVGSRGTSYGQRAFGSLYSPGHFHHNVDSEQWNCLINERYTNVGVMHNCDFGKGSDFGQGLPDLNTSQAYVRTKLAGLLANLRSLGAAGFRIDAAKHLPSADLAAILSEAGSGNQGSTTAPSDIIQEVIIDWQAPAALNPKEYVRNGRVTDFDYAYLIAERLGGKHDGMHGLKWILNDGGFNQHLPSSQALVFIDNHDTQRHKDTRLTYKDGARYVAANAFMLAWPFGRPRLMSSYDLKLDKLASKAGPPHEISVHNLSALGQANCGAGRPWLCEHRTPLIANMVGWRQQAGKAPVTHWQTGSHKGQVAFSRNGAAFIAFSVPNDAGRDAPGGLEWRTTLQTGLPAGTYCQLTAVDSCDNQIVVETTGIAAVHVKWSLGGVVAIHVGWQLAPTASPSH